MPSPVLRQRYDGLCVDRSGTGFDLDGIHFKTTNGQSGILTDHDGVVLIKDWAFVEDELTEIADNDIRRMLEVGIFQGGSAALWPLVLPLERYAGIDIRDTEQLAFPPSVTEHPRWKVVRLYGKTSQDDASTLNTIIDGLGGPLDLVVDDASHEYRLTERTFEIVFPRMRAGGMYIIEDWAWAERPGPWDEPTHPWYARDSLTNLILRLTLLHGARPEIITRMVMRRGFVALWRGGASLDDHFDIESSYPSRRRLTQVI